MITIIIISSSGSYSIIIITIISLNTITTTAIIIIIISVIPLEGHFSPQAAENCLRRGGGEYSGARTRRMGNHFRRLLVGHSDHDQHKSALGGAVVFTVGREPVAGKRFRVLVVGH